MRQKARDYQRLHSMYTELVQKQTTMSDQETQKQNDLKASLSHLTTNQHSLQREVDELKAINTDQKEKLAHARE